MHDEARSYLAQSEQRYSLIQASLIDTWAATGAGAHALGENGLYTLEARQLFLDRLTPNGVFTVSRWSTVETARLIVLAVGTLLESGVAQPRDHIAIVTAGSGTTLLISKSALGSADERRIQQIAADKGFVVATLPSMRSPSERIERILNARSLAEVNAASLLPLLDFRASTDDRPFFFNVLRLRSFFYERPPQTVGSLEGNLLATRTLGMAFLASCLLVVGAILIPLYRRSRPQSASRTGLWASLLYFSMIGVGFMLAEIALLQRLSLILGHPSYSLIVVLSSLVASAGLGSLLSDRLPLDQRPWCYVYPLLIAAALAVVALAWPSWAPQIASLPIAVRIAFAAGIISMLGLLMGMAFPTGMRLVSHRHPDERPWLWGMNGVGSVLASSVAILLALEFGLTFVLLCAAGCYLGLLLPIARLSRPDSA